MTMQTNYTRIINILRTEVLYGLKRLTHRIFCRDVVAVDLLNLSRLVGTYAKSIISEQTLAKFYEMFPPRHQCGVCTHLLMFSGQCVHCLLVLNLLLLPLCQPAS